jgi:chromosome segregation ATPase
LTKRWFEMDGVEQERCRELGDRTTSDIRAELEVANDAREELRGEREELQERVDEVESALKGFGVEAKGTLAARVKALHKRLTDEPPEVVEKLVALRVALDDAGWLMGEQLVARVKRLLEVKTQEVRRVNELTARCRVLDAEVVSLKAKLEHADGLLMRPEESAAPADLLGAAVAGYLKLGQRALWHVARSRGW